MIGAHIDGKYRVVREIGAGGMGVVYEAEHEELERPVAVKVIRRDRVDAEATERFLAEARIAARLDHPNLVDVFDLGRLDDGTPFMVMPLLRGKDLAAFGRVPIDDALDMLADAAAGLDALHARKLAHRDVKPENLFVTDDGRVVVMDFGLAALAGEGTRLTQRGIVIGTPHYVAPECTTGAKAGARADLYSFGVVAYEMLGGRLPFDEDPNPTKMLAAKMSGAAPPLSARSRRELSARYDAVFARALSRHPEDRHESCTELVRALRAAHEDRAASVPLTLPTSATPRLVVTALALLALAGGVAWWATPEEHTSTDAATTDDETPEPEVEALNRGPYGAGASEATYPEAGSLRQAGWNTPPLTSDDGDAHGLERAEPRPPRRGRAEPDELRPSPDADRDAARALTDEATRLALRGRLPAAIRAYEEATSLDASYPPAWRGLGVSHARLGHTPEARRAFERYLTLRPDAHDAPRVRERLASLP